MNQSCGFSKILKAMSQGRCVGFAPMAGISDMPYRLLCAEQGAAFAVTEMISAKGLVYNPNHAPQVERLYALAPHEAPVGLQLFGSEPPLLAQAAQGLWQRGYAFVDVNMGCPATKIVKNGEGSALMRTPRRIGEIVSALVKVSGIPVTVKLRAGWDEGQKNAVECARIAQEAGAAMVTIHGRTRAQQYAGRADWDIIAKVKQALAIPVIGNGDVVDEKSALLMLRHTGCDGVMVGRAAQGNPWVFARIRSALGGRAFKEPTPRQRVYMALRHADMLSAFAPGRTAVLEMRKQVVWYTHGLSGSAALRTRINQIADLPALRGALFEYLEYLRADADRIEKDAMKTPQLHG